MLLWCGQVQARLLLIDSLTHSYKDVSSCALGPASNLGLKTKGSLTGRGNESWNGQALETSMYVSMWPREPVNVWTVWTVTFE